MTMGMTMGRAMGEAPAEAGAGAPATAKPKLKTSQAEGKPAQGRLGRHPLREGGGPCPGSSGHCRGSASLPPRGELGHRGGDQARLIDGQALENRRRRRPLKGKGYALGDSEAVALGCMRASGSMQAGQAVEEVGGREAETSSM